MRFASVYGFDSSQGNADLKNSDLHDEIFGDMAELGNTQWVLGEDWNKQAEEIHPTGSCHSLSGHKGDGDRTGAVGLIRITVVEAAVKVGTVTGCGTVVREEGQRESEAEVRAAMEESGGEVPKEMLDEMPWEDVRLWM